MANPFYNDDDNFDPDDPIHAEEEEVKRQLKLLASKIQGKSNEDVTNADLLQYMRAINLNFATMHRIIVSFYMKLDVIEDYLVHVNDKLDEFVESSGEIDEAMKDDDKEGNESTSTDES